MITFFFRIIRKLVLEKYLWEVLAVSAEGVVSAYVKPGPKAQNGQIKTDKITINIEVKSTVKVASANRLELLLLQDFTDRWLYLN